MYSGRGYHVLGDFSFKTMACEFTPNFVYLFMYPFVDGYLALWHARAPARIVSLACVLAAGTTCWVIFPLKQSIHGLSFEKGNSSGVKKELFWVKNG